MELPTVAGILRRSSEIRTDTQVYEESDQSSPPFQDKGSVRFVDEEMDSRLLEMSSGKDVFMNQCNITERSIEEENDDDYSVSVSAILQRRASSRRGKRRSSSPFSDVDFSCQSTPRRRSSAITTTSETAISINEPDMKEEQIFENIRLHKEVIANVKHQPWTVRRKMKLIEQAKAYIKRHEGELQVRLKRSRSTRDILTRFNIVLVKKWNHTKRELINFMNLLIPWELRIKEIESHFGTVVASYFTFLRWLFWVNLVTSIILTAFVIVPEILLKKKSEDNGFRKELPPGEKKITLDILLNFEGILKYSPLFYGYYSDRETVGEYKIPTAYFMVGVGVYIYSFIATLRKMAVNFRLSKLSEKEDECIFTWKLFTGWDYMIGNAETGHNRTSSIVLGFKEALLEEAEKKKEKRSWRIISVRIFVNLNVIWMLIFSAQAVIYVVNKSNYRPETYEKEPLIVKWWYQNETTVVMTVIGSVFPFIFEMFGFIEKYHPRKTLRIQLARIMALNLLNLYTLTFALFSQIDGMTKQLHDIRSNLQNLTTENVTLTQYASASLMHVNPGLYYSNISNRTKDTFVTQHRLQKRNIPEEKNKSIDEKQMFLQKEFMDPATGMYHKFFTPTQSSITFPILVKANATTGIQKKTTELSYTFEYTMNDTASKSDDDDDFSKWSSYNTEYETYFENDSTTFFNDNEIEFSTNETYGGDNRQSTEPIWDTSVTPKIILNNSTYISTDGTLPSLVMENSSYETTATNIMSHTSEIILSTESIINITRNEMPFSNKARTEINPNSTSVAGTASNITTPPSTTVSIPLYCKETPRFEDDNGTSDKTEDLSTKARTLDEATKNRLRRLCWETMFGQELVKLTVMDLVSSFVSTFVGDFIRALLVRYMNKFWCWDLEKKFPKYADFKIAENILHLVNNQGLVWMGMFFSPGLPLINVVKLMIMMYLRSWAVLTCNVPHEVVFRASRSNNFYLALLLTMLFLCVLPVCYAIVWLKPSWHCGPFSNYKRIYLIFATTLRALLPKKFHKIMDYMATPGTVIPLIIVLLLVIYYLASLTSALREANIDLKIQLRRERTVERKKMFQMASRRRRGGSDMDSSFGKWKKILQGVNSMKMSEDSTDYLDDQKKDDTYISNAESKSNDDTKKLFKKPCKNESEAEKKWGTLLKMVPPTSTDSKIKDSSMILSGREDSSLISNVMREIKINRVQTMDNILKSERNPDKLTTKITEVKKRKDEIIKPVIVEHHQQKLPKLNTKEALGVPLTGEDKGEHIDLDEVFLKSVVVEIPEVPTIHGSISNRIKRRLCKIISRGSSGENQFCLDTERKHKIVKMQHENMDDSLSKVLGSSKILPASQSTRLMKSESWNTKLEEQLETRRETRRHSSLDNIHIARQ